MSAGMSDALHYFTVAEASRQIASGNLSPVALTEAYLERIAAIDGKLNAYLLVLADQARAAAREAEAAIRAGRRRGPLHGIPIGLKDIYDTAQVRTTGNSKVMQDRVPSADSTVTRRLAEAGTILLGKLATHEFAVGGPSFDLPWPPARNPWNRSHMPGGSSSGSGAAVAAGLCGAAMGSDTGGSIRGPAALCGLAGLKPTYGRVSRRGVLPLSWTLDHTGPMCWTSEDCALVLQAIAGYDPGDPASADAPVGDYSADLNKGVKGLRIGVVRHFFEKDLEVSADTIAAVDAAIGVLRGLGAIVEEVTLSPLADFHACGMTIMLAEAFSIHADKLRARPLDYGEIARDRMLLGALIEGYDYVDAMRLRRTLCEETAAVLGRCDVLVTTTVPGPAPKIDHVPKYNLIKLPLMTMPWDVTGSPAHAVCCGFSADGLPLSFSVIGRPFDEATVLRVGHAYEQATPWRQRRPAI
jgi:aspartyl-tRNA(Asn)/glutamyl-tRNA(Gln) amidotransferase subunit A